MNDSILKKVSDYLGFDEETVAYLSKIAQTSYKHYKINKKKGGKRTIHHPSKLTKSLQYAIIEIVLRGLSVSDSAIAYKRGVISPTKKNALLHAKYRYSVMLDFQDFFHSIKPRDLFAIMSGDDKYKNIEKDDKTFLENCLFIKYNNKKGLAIGAPSSPIVSNVVMYNLDERINSISKIVSNDSIYTRYADDIVFSTNQKGKSSEFYNRIRELIKECKTPSLSFNNNKTKFTSRKTKRVVTGLFITPEERISIGRKNKRYIKKLLYDFKNNSIEEQGIKYLNGYLSYILDVEPEFYNRLVLKYGSKTVNSALRFENSE